MIQAKPILFEQPTHEHVRVCLRLEHLFAQVMYWSQGDNHWQSRAALAALVEILNVLDRPDLKTKLVKELGRYSSVLARFAEMPNVDRSCLNSIQNEINLAINHLHAMQGRIAQSLRENDFLTTIRQHLSNPGGGCSFDVPCYHYWLQQPASERMAQLVAWLGNLKVIRSAIDLSLRLIRQSSVPQWQMAEQGFYQATLNAQAPSQLIQVALPVSAEVYPEISVGRHGISIRFYHLNLGDRPMQAQKNIAFQLTCCVF